jgi:uncharacterized damage-inducible protein DinB
MTAAESRLHLRYSAWASRRLVEAVRVVPDADFEKPVGVSHVSIQGTLGHILFGDWIWFTRVVEPMEKPGETREVLETVWPELHRKWDAWAGQASDADLNRVVQYNSMNYGESARTPIWQIILHVCNHGTLHRGQVMGMLRQMGIAPPHTDMMNFFLESTEYGPGLTLPKRP